MSLIEVAGLCKSFRIPSVRRDTLREHALAFFGPRRHEELRVLDGVDFRVEPGDSLGIMGRNGCGKTTLLRILCGIYRPGAGTVAVRAPITAVLGLGVGWDPELDAVDNVCLLGTVMGLTLGEARRAIAPVLAFAGLERFARLPLKHWSSGMASRLAYAVAFQAVREVLVLDEVFAVGDAEFRARCEARFRELVAAGTTVILVSHDPRVVAAFCRRGLVLEAGRVVVDGDAVGAAAAYLELMGADGMTR